MKHVVLSKVNKHLSSNHILSKKQHGFRQSLSCATQLIESLHDWAFSLNASSGIRCCQVDAVLLDFSKAFDRVAHGRHLQKLNYYGIRGDVLGWIEAFLRGRIQRVPVNGTHSKSISVSSGVPQGSVLGPMLFLIYINDIDKGIKSTVRLFADDSILYRTIWCYEDQVALQRDLNTLQLWADKWLMDFNVSKCKVITISQKKTPTPFKYTLKGDVLKNVKEHPYLGVTISSMLSNSNHYNNIIKSATRA